MPSLRACLACCAVSLAATVILPGGPAGAGEFSAAHNAPNASSPGPVFRSYCVRLCDGYYWPLSFAVGEAGLARDEKRCTTSCGSPARLFFAPLGGGSIVGMTDKSGQAYADLPTAFKFQKSLIDGCVCKAMPWTAAETARHRQYAQIEAAGPPVTARLETGPATVVAPVSMAASASARVVLEIPVLAQQPAQTLLKVRSFIARAKRANGPAKDAGFDDPAVYSSILDQDGRRWPSAMLFRYR